MRTKTITIHTFDELDDKAKEVARNWWRACEDQDPACISEHRQSIEWALDQLSRDDVDTVRTEADAMDGTGYCADALLADLIRELDRMPTRGETVNRFDEAWQAEMDSRMEADYVDEQILANGYEFYVSGEIA